VSALRRTAPEGVPSRGHPSEGLGVLQDGQPPEVDLDGRDGLERILVEVEVGGNFFVLELLVVRLDVQRFRRLRRFQGEVGLTTAEIGVFGGSGFYSFLDDVREIEVQTPYGEPSSPLLVGQVAGRTVAFIPRHGAKHQFPPHRINYRANLWAMKEAGVRRVLGPCAVGSLRTDVEPGHFVVCDQLVDRTTGRADTFYDGPVTTHISFADPYCPQTRAVIIEEARGASLRVHETGTVVVVQGPRFSTRSESAWYQSQGWEVINMTQYPEAALARELELCYSNISLVTDYDVGVPGDRPPVSHEEVVRVFDENLGRLRDLLFAVIAALPGERSCDCGTALSGARFDV
jgi:5'-methylthioadenosine phosphorylase